jgi:hypothetical protein
MLESIKTLFGFATSGFKIGEELVKILRRRRGKARLLFEELKLNQDLLVMVVEEGTDHFKVIPRFATQQYDALLGENYDFDSISKKQIKGNEKLKKSDIGYFIGKSTEFLIEDIYDKIKEIKTRYEVDKYNPKIDWRRRIINLYKRLVLLIHHLRQ